jgi:methionyl aminopeptidase
MITFKSQEDFLNMEKAGRIVATIHSELREASTPGIPLTTLDELAKSIVEKSGSTSSFLGYMGYPAYICASPNDVIVHGIPGKYILDEGDILSIDVGVSVNGYHADAALTYGVGKISAETIGNKIEKIGNKFSYGVVKEYVGHGIGLEMHEDPQVPNYGKKNQGFTLKKGMAICIEPMFNIGSAQTKVDDDEWTVRTFDGSNSAHWEHTIGIMDDEVRIFTEK